MKGILFCVMLTCWLLPERASSQDTPILMDKIISFPNNFLSQVNKKTTFLESKLTSASESYLKKLSKQEGKIKKHLAKNDSLSASKLFPSGIQNQYAAYIQKMKSDSSVKNLRSSGIYYPNTDSLMITLNYLKANPQILSKSNISTAQLQSAINRLTLLQGKLNYSDQINQFIAQRKQQFQQILAKYTTVPSSLKNSYANYQKQAVFYADQVKSYKESLNDPQKVMSMALAVLYKVPAFNNFAKSNSMLSGLFGPPANLSPGTATQGLQTRTQVQSMLQDKIGIQGTSGMSKIQSSVQSAQGEIDGLRDKLNASGSGDLNMPDFQGNNQRTKSFLHRIEYGANLQTASNNYFFPITTNVALSVGYRLNKSNVVGFSVAYKIGWGSDIHHIQLSSQGIGLGSFADIKIKKTYFLSGGFEYNYQQPFNPLHVFNNLDNWTKSGLIGISKIVDLKTKFVKKSKVSLLWDLLSYQQIPRTQPFVFRVGYSF